MSLEFAMSAQVTHALVFRRFYEPERRPLTSHEAEGLRQAIAGLRTILSFEDKFYVVIENLLELELCLAEIAARHMVRPLLKDEEFGDKIREANRRVINLLTSFRLYRDQTVHHFAPLLPLTDIKALFKAEEKSSFAFRVVEALRNHVQHRDLPVHTMTLGSDWAGEPPAHKLRHHARLAINLEQLASDECFPKGVLAELKAIPEIPDLRLLLRQYASVMGQIHRNLREAFAEAQTGWMKVLDDAASGWGTSTNEDDVDLGLAVAELRNGDLIEAFEIYAKLADRVRDMQQRNFCCTALDRAFFTSEAVDKKRA